MIKPSDPRDLAVNLLPRSTCSIKVAAVAADKWGIFGWGWNSMGFTGFGTHAEHDCILRSNRKRLRGATVYVAAARTRTGRPVPAKPCPDCEIRLLRAGVGKIVWRDREGKWQRF